MAADVQLIIAGGRDFSDRKLFNSRISSFVEEHGAPTLVISGMAPGADSMGYHWAVSQGLVVMACRAEWKKHGRAAGPIRNKQMARLGTHLFAFWDGQSPGTRDMIKQATRFGLQVEVARY